MRTKIVFLLIICFFSFVSFAGLPWDPDDTSHVPVQVFRQVTDITGNGGSDSLQKKTDGSRSSSIKKSDTVTSSSPSETAVTHATVESNKETLEGATPDPSKVEEAASLPSGLQDQINQLNQNSLLFQQTTNYKLDGLRQHLTALQQRLEQLDQAVILLNQEVGKLSQRGISSTPSPATMPAERSFEDYIFWGISLFIIASLMIFIGLQRKPKNNTSEATQRPLDETEGDYDYMGSAESVPAKLNLVRAYIAMENFTEARQVLASILPQACPEQRQEAENLAQKIPPETSE